MRVTTRLALFAATILTSPPLMADEPAKPKLVVLVYFDQFRGDYLARWKGEFGEGGFKRLTADGAWFTNCHYPYAYTVTAAGHSSVATGCPPVDHGIVGNDWYERAAGKSVNCVGADRYYQVPARTKEGADEDEKKGAKGGVSPDRLMKPTIGDALKAGTGGKGKVVGLSLKNRGATLPAGKTPDAAYWMDGGTGQFVTSNYYRDGVHPWVAEFNRRKFAEQWHGKTWERFRADIDYAKLSGPDDISGESRGAAGQGRVFPHPFEPTDMKTKPAYLNAFYTSPFGNEMLLELAEKAITAESLGADDVPDLLTLSFSSNDAIGHAWGPDSQEVLDVTLRSDRIMKRLLDALDTKVGKGKYLLVMSADHGVCPLPEMSRKQGRDAARVQPAASAKVEAFLVEKFGKQSSKWVEAISGPWVYLSDKTAKAAGVISADVHQALAEWLQKQDGVSATYTRKALTAGIPDTDATGQMVARSFYPERCGDVYVLLKPYYLSSATLGTGTTHGSPWEYDTHVPLVVYGTGVTPGVRAERVAPLAAAAVLSKAAGVTPPSGSKYGVPEGLFGASGK
ncbi:alkaline phosphatase family protein [Limnoglobus roseus]|uniref:Alkaline phosphatase family protein n=1 Tax=Limnoglobus roseus TaxID=2598579 RepID=A0A5C1AQB2_9BACT|nr:alkaline phosphatase family protein [Limnoglobus roseus]QEL19048.1 alkaline phosphatase family protein [Limnoglobus roseus]